MKNNKKKVTWKVTSGKKNITLKSKKKTGVTVVGRKKGTAKVQAKVGKKKYSCTVTVKAKAKATPKPTTQLTKAPTPTAKPTTKPTAIPTKTPGQDEILTLYYNDKNAEAVKEQIHYSDVPVHVIVEDSVTSIGDDAFCGTVWLSAKQAENPLVIVNHILTDGEKCVGDIQIPDSVTSIGGYAFSGCRELTSITLPDSVISIGNYAFGNYEYRGSDYGLSECSNLTSITWKGNTYTSVDAFLTDFENAKK